MGYDPGIMQGWDTTQFVHHIEIKNNVMWTHADRGGYKE